MARETELIAAIYDGAADPKGWDEAVRCIVKASKSLGGGLVCHRADGAAQVASVCNVDPFYATAYVQHYHKMSPLVAAAWRVAPGEVQAQSYITQSNSYKASAFFNEWAGPQGWADIVAIGLLRTPFEVLHMRFSRSPGAVWVEPPEWRLLETLAPHLKRAASVRELLARATAVSESLGAAVAAAGFAVFLLTGDCRILFANAKAEELVRCATCMRCVRGRLCATNPALTHHLHALARQGARSATAEGEIGGTIELSCGEDRPPLLAHVIPLAPNRTVTIFDIERPAAALFIVDPVSDLAAQIRRFAERFGLTPAETRVLGKVIGGNGLQAAAAQLKVTRATVRTHADHIFQKTGTGRQTELIRRFFETSLPGSLPNN